MAVSVLRPAAAESSGHLRVPRDGGWSLWNYLLRSRPRSRARVVAGSGGIDRKDPGPARTGEVDLERRLAKIDDRPLPDERFDLVDSFFAVPVRRVAF